MTSTDFTDLHSPTGIPSVTAVQPSPESDLLIRYGLGECSLGALLVAESSRGLCAILLGDEPARLVDDLRARFPSARAHSDEAFQTLIEKVARHIDHPGNPLEVLLDTRGTAFQECVWNALQDIPAGRTLSYAALAASIGRPTATRAVARACGANSLAVVIPCHRVVRRNGDLGGYRWGLARKQELLRREGRIVC